MNLFELGKILFGKAAGLAGMARVEFLEVCALHGVSVYDYGPDELNDELARDLDVVRKRMGE